MTRGIFALDMYICEIKIVYCSSLCFMYVHVYVCMFCVLLYECVCTFYVHVLNASFKP